MQLLLRGWQFPASISVKAYLVKWSYSAGDELNILKVVKYTKAFLSKNDLLKHNSYNGNLVGDILSFQYILRYTEIKIF